MWFELKYREWHCAYVRGPTGPLFPVRRPRAAGWARKWQDSAGQGQRPQTSGVSAYAIGKRDRIHGELLKLGYGSGIWSARRASHSSGSMASMLRPSEGFVRDRYSTAFWHHATSSDGLLVLERDRITDVRREARMSPGQELPGEFLGDRVSLDQVRQQALAEQLHDRVPVPGLERLNRTIVRERAVNQEKTENRRRNAAEGGMPVHNFASYRHCIERIRSSW